MHSFIFIQPYLTSEFGEALDFDNLALDLNLHPTVYVPLCLIHLNEGFEFEFRFCAKHTTCWCVKGNFLVSGLTHWVPG